MASLFGDDGVDDLLNDQLIEEPDLPDGDEEDADKLFGDADAAAEDVGIKVEPKKRAVRNPRPRLTAETLRGPRGLQTIEDYFKDMKFQGKGHEQRDLDEVMRRLQHWAHRMYPTYKFDDVLDTIERLGRRKPVQVHMTRYRLGQLESMQLVDQALAHDQEEDGDVAAAADEPFDEFDALLGEQIAMSRLAPRTPANHKRSDPSTPYTNSTLATPSFARGHAVASTPKEAYDTSVLAVPLPATPAPAPKPQLSSEQMARIAENRRLAQERLKAKKLPQVVEEPATTTLES